MSARKYSIDQLAALYECDRDRVSQWRVWWLEYQYEGLDDEPRSGRPPTLNAKEQAQARALVEEAPRDSKPGLQRIADEIGKVISQDTLRRILHAGD